MTITNTLSKIESDKASTVQRVADRADLVAFWYAWGWYAWGRLDQGHPPVVGSEQAGAVNSTDTAWLFGRMYAEQERAFAASETGHAYGIQTAWENFVLTEGKSLSTPR